jgi:hypothetical protein
MIVENFQHRHAGHCESGVTASLLTHYGLPMTEPMAFGLSASLTFVHLPFVKIGGFPLTAYRMLPGSIYKGLRGALGLKMNSQRFSDETGAMAALDAELAAGHPVGLQTSVFWLSYFPQDMRFHFNAHNMIVYGKDGDDYLVSDPVFDQPQRCPSKDLQKARFTQGAFAPKGLMYFPKAFNKDFNLDQAVRRAIKKTWRMMLYTPVPFVGVGAIRRLANSVEKLPQKHPDPRYARLYVGNIVRMQEEIGTGGGGFRFMYAAFLQETGKKLNNALLLEAAAMMTATGDCWREFALMGAQFGRKKEDVNCTTLAAKLRQCADQEEAVYRLLKKL